MKFTKQLHRFYGNRHRASAMRTFIDLWWFSILRVSLALVLIGFLLGGWVLFEAIRGVEGSGEAMVTSDTLNRTQLKETLEHFDTERAAYENLKDSLPSIVDPSR